MKCGSAEIARDVQLLAGEPDVRLAKRVSLHDWAAAILSPEVCTQCGYVELRAQASPETLQALRKPTFVPRVSDHWLDLKRNLLLKFMAVVIAALLIWLIFTLS
ncbi:MAG: hypothetical protein ACKO3P_08305 [Planctomycetaceae bacterium]